MLSVLSSVRKDMGYLVRLLPGLKEHNEFESVLCAALFYRCKGY